jgi:hypothetical protein
MTNKMILWNEYKTIYFLVKKMRSGEITLSEYKTQKRQLAG